MKGLTFADLGKSDWSGPGVVVDHGEVSYWQRLGDLGQATTIRTDMSLSRAATEFANNLLIAVARGVWNITDFKSASVRLFHEVDAGG